MIDVVVTPSRTWVEEAMRANGEDPTEGEGEEEKKPPYWDYHYGCAIQQEL
jgi:hypothetical protein